MKLMVINGPNLNFLGIRERNIYGTVTFKDLEEKIRNWCKDEEIEAILKQSNHEGDLVDYIQEAYFEKVDGIIINPGAYTHTSIALLDALKAVNIKAIEVHISDVSKREDFRQISYIRSACFLTIAGLGIEGYHKAILEMKKELLKNQ